MVSNARSCAPAFPISNSSWRAIWTSVIPGAICGKSAPSASVEIVHAMANAATSESSFVARKDSMTPVVATSSVAVS